MRLFLAIDVERDIKDRMIRLQNGISARGADIRWSTADQLHMTLKFLGEVGEAQLAPLSQAVSRVAGECSAFELRISGSGCYPPEGPVRIIWVGGQDPSGTLRLVVQRLEDEFAKLGFPRETRTFSEHFTIGRVKSDRTHGTLRRAVQTAGFENAVQRVRELVLYESTLTRAGARYSPIFRAALAGS